MLSMFAEFGTKRTLLKNPAQVYLDTLKGLTLRLVDGHCPREDERQLGERAHKVMFMEDMITLTCVLLSCSSPLGNSTFHVSGCTNNLLFPV